MQIEASFLRFALSTHAVSLHCINLGPDGGHTDGLSKSREEGCRLHNA